MKRQSRKVSEPDMARMLELSDHEFETNMVHRPRTHMHEIDRM